MQNLEEYRPNAEALLLQGAKHRLLRQAMAELPTGFRDVLALRELEGFSYKEIADMVEIPLGTVMSRLARARKCLEHMLSGLPEQNQLRIAAS